MTKKIFSYLTPVPQTSSVKNDLSQLLILRRVCKSLCFTAGNDIAEILFEEIENRLNLLRAAVESKNWNSDFEDTKLLQSLLSSLSKHTDESNYVRKLMKKKERGKRFDRGFQLCIRFIFHWS